MYFRSHNLGTYKVRNEIEINETKSTKTKRNGNEMKRNQRKQNEENGRKKIKDKTK